MEHASPVQFLNHATLCEGRSNGHAHAVGILLQTGSIDVQLRRRFTVRAGELYIVPADAPHALLGASADTAGWGFRLRPDFAAATKRSHAIPLDTQDVADMEAWLRRIHREHGRADPCSLAMKESLLHAVHVQCARAVNAGHCGTFSPVIARALAIIQTEFVGELRPRDIADRVGITAAHLSHEFRRQTGKSPSEWIAQMRIDAARRELLLSNATLSTVAERVGYADVSQLHRQFRRAVGMTPDAWRRANANSSMDS